MKKLCMFLVNVSVVAGMPIIAGAAGTYYNGSLYQKSQQRYGSASGGYYNTYGAGRGYGQQYVNNNYPATTSTKKSKTKTLSEAKYGLFLDVNASHEFANWDIDMKQAGSKLHYNNLRWNVISGEGTYYFGNTTPMQIKVGGAYGRQFGESPMIDDDISEEGMWGIQTIQVNSTSSTTSYENILIGTPALSVGTSSGGTQYGFNAALGFTDFFKFGDVKITPLIGYRYFKYNLETKNNYGLVMQVLDSESFVNCLTGQDGEVQCSPYVAFINSSGEDISYAGFVFDTQGNLLLNENGLPVVYNNVSAPQINVGSTYYYEQKGTSHKYETEWAGPYVALDMEYKINDKNVVVGNIELGLPIYKSKGDQPYRIDWAHPTSVEDTGELGDAYHFGLNTLWTTKLTDSMGLSFGFTYDYYSIKGATATTYLNPSYDNYAPTLEILEDLTASERESLGYEELYEELESLKSNGWKTESKNEIDSIYKSMGIRIGLDIKF